MPYLMVSSEWQTMNPCSIEVCLRCCQTRNVVIEPFPVHVISKGWIIEIGPLLKSSSKPIMDTSNEERFNSSEILSWFMISSISYLDDDWRIRLSWQSNLKELLLHRDCPFSHLVSFSPYDVLFDDFKKKTEKREIRVCR
jgi:hypothetical protein